MEKDEKAKALKSSSLASKIANLAILCQCSLQLGFHHSLASELTALITHQNDAFTADITEREIVAANFDYAMLSSSITNSRVGAPTGQRFASPVGKPWTKQNVEAMRKAESNLDIFWKVVYGVMNSKVDGFPDTACYRLLTQGRSLQRTPVWVQPAKGNPKLAEEDLKQALSEQCFELQRRTEQNISSEKSVPIFRAKVKTHGPAHFDSADAENDDIVAEPEPHSSCMQYVVDSRAFKGFKSLFFSPSSDASPGEVSWADFLHAMVSAGFTAEKLYGSVWQFNLTIPDAKTDEPHPSGKIPFLGG